MRQQSWHPLLTVAGKVLAKIMLTRHLEHVVDLVLSESQCGFLRGRSTIDMMFVARQLQEECREQHQNLYMAFVDLTKAFDTVNRDLIWNILRKNGCPLTFIATLLQFHIVCVLKLSWLVLSPPAFLLKWE